MCGTCEKHFFCLVACDEANRIFNIIDFIISLNEKKQKRKIEGLEMRYLTGECPEIGDVVHGKPNNSEKDYAGIVAATHEGSLCLVVIFPLRWNNGKILGGDAKRLYGEACNFELLKRN